VLLKLVQHSALLLLYLVQLGLQLLDLLGKVVNLSSGVDATICVVGRLWVARLPNAALIDILQRRRWLQTHLRVVDHRQLPGGRMLHKCSSAHLRLRLKSLRRRLLVVLLLNRNDWLLH